MPYFGRYAKPGTNILGPLSFGPILLAPARKGSPRSSELKICSFCIPYKEVEDSEPYRLLARPQPFLIGFFISYFYLFFIVFVLLEVPVEDPSKACTLLFAKYPLLLTLFNNVLGND